MLLKAFLMKCFSDFKKFLQEIRNKREAKSLIANVSIVHINHLTRRIHLLHLKLLKKIRNNHFFSLLQTNSDIYRLVKNPINNNNLVYTNLTMCFNERAEPAFCNRTNFFSSDLGD